MRNFKSTYEHQGEEPLDAELEDYDVGAYSHGFLLFLFFGCRVAYLFGSTDCDQLANAQNDGRAISDAPPAVRKRAALEKGLQAFFHGG